jgi:hypothetical protein
MPKLTKPTQQQISANLAYQIRTFNASQEQRRFDAMRQIDPSAFVLTLTPPDSQQPIKATNQPSLFEVSR